MNTKYEFGSVKVQTPSLDEAGWYTIEQQSFTIDKREFVLEKFSKDFPKIRVRDFDQFEKVLNRSVKLQDWYSKTSLLYAESIQLPVSFKENFSPSEYKGFFKDIGKYKEYLVEESKEIEILARKFDDDIKAIKRKWSEYRDKVISKNPIYRILILNTGELPLSLQIEIENYTPSTGDITQKKRLYAQEMLICYQKALLEAYNNDNTINIDEVIEENSVK